MVAPVHKTDLRSSFSILMSKQRKIITITGTPVLMYHGISREQTSSRADRFAVSINDFRTQIGLLASMGCAALDDIRTGVSFGRNAVAITFDDGLESDFTVAFPLLQEHGLVAHFFINAANVGQPGYMDWQQIRELNRAGMHIGSHGYRHISLTEVNDATLLGELAHSRKVLENELQTEVAWFAAPYGLITTRIVRVAYQTGYKGVCTSRCWPARQHNSATPRVAISRETSMKEFRSLVDRKCSIYWRRNLAAAAKYVPRRVLVRIRPSVLGVSVSGQPL